MKIHRRHFIGSTLAAMALPGRPVLGANEQVRVAIIGVNGKGGQHIKQFGGIKNVKVAALVDPDAKVLKQRAQSVPHAVDTHADLRRVLDDPNIDAVVVAAPNHWHGLATVWACQAGKDVYVEKPAAWAIPESRKIIEAARTHKRMVQVGTQRRSDTGMAEAAAFIQKGELGKITCARVLHFGKRGSIGKVAGAQPPPDAVDFDLWSGPAEKVILRKRFHYDWHWFWNTGNGEIGNNGPHTLDLARWCMGTQQLAPRVMSIGGRYGWNDSGETANTQLVFYDYQPAPMIVEVRNLPMKTGSSTSDVYKGIRVGVVIECEHGWFAGLNGGAAYDKDGKKIRSFSGDNGASHPANFIAAVRSRKRKDLNADIVEGHLSAGLCHMGNISHRLGAATNPEAVRERIVEQALTTEAFGRFGAHLDANGIDIEKQNPQLGPMLQFDLKQEHFFGAAAEGANALLKRKVARPPFVMPEKV